MFKHLLVPLDGSSLAEAILPAAKSIGSHFNAHVTLLHVVEPHPPTTVHGDRHLMNAAAAASYLDQIAERFRSAGVEVDFHVDVVERGDVPKTIFAHTGELDADLVMLTSHGQSGLREILFGNIAQQVLQEGRVPVFIVRPEMAGTPFEPKKILVPLDSSTLYEPALNVAGEFAQAYHSRIHLVLVVPTMSTLSAERAATGLLLPSSTKAMLDLAQSGGAEYLQRRVDSYIGLGIGASAEVERGDPPTKILEVAEREGADFFVLATHGRAGLDAFWSGSVAPKVLARAKAPVLLLRVFGPEPVH